MHVIPFSTRCLMIIDIVFVDNHHFLVVDSHAYRFKFNHDYRTTLLLIVIGWRWWYWDCRIFRMPARARVVFFFYPLNSRPLTCFPAFFPTWHQWCCGYEFLTSPIASCPSYSPSLLLRGIDLVRNEGCGEHGDRHWSRNEFVDCCAVSWTMEHSATIIYAKCGNVEFIM